MEIRNTSDLFPPPHPYRPFTPPPHPYRPFTPPHPYLPFTPPPSLPSLYPPPSPPSLYPPPPSPPSLYPHPPSLPFSQVNFILVLYYSPVREMLSQSLAGNSCRLIWVMHSSHKSIATHSHKCVEYFCVSSQWHGCQCLAF